MRKLLFALITCIAFWGCSTSPNSNGGTNTTVIPIAPSNLTGVVVSSSKVNLSWTDNSTNETGFKIERRLDGSVSFINIGTVNSNVISFNDTGLVANTTYTYRVLSFNNVGNSLQYSNEITITTDRILSVALVTTNLVNSIGTTTAISGGEIINDGGAPILVRGVCWSAISGPTVSLTTKTTDGNGIGSFVSNISGLSPNTTYYVRAYATNSIGTAYGSEVTFTTNNSQTYSYTPGPNVIDVNGYIYASITTSCGQTWTTKNLNVSHYRNGDIIPQVTDANQWANLTTGAWCWYNNDSATYSQYGKLYNWYAVNDSRGLAPLGWHVPSDTEWNKFIKCLDVNADTTIQQQSFVVGGYMKETGLTHWQSPNTAGSNLSGLICLPSGGRGQAGEFSGLGYYALFSSSNDISSSMSLVHQLFYQSALIFYFAGDKKFGYSIRLIRD